MNNGGQGEEPPTRSEMVLYQRAIRNRWPVGPKLKRRIVRAMAKVVENHDSNERDKIGAARVLVAADALNAKREQTESQADTAGQVQRHEHLHANVTELLNDPEYLAYRRSRLRDADAGAVRGLCESGPMADGGDARADRRGSNGHHHGQNGAGAHP